MHAGGRNDEKHLSKRKPPVASSALVSGRSRDTGLGNMVSRPAGKQGVSHRTDSSLPETAAPVNRPAPDFSTAAEPPAPPRLTTDEARRACGTTAITVCKDETDNYGLSQKRRPLVSSARENPHNGGKSLNYGDTAGGSFIHSSRRQEAFTTIAGNRCHSQSSCPRLFDRRGTVRPAASDAGRGPAVMRDGHIVERFTFEKGETRGGDTAPPGPK